MFGSSSSEARTGETWNVYLDRDGVGFFEGSRDSGIGGLVRVRQRIPDLPGEEVIRAAGHNVVTGEVCRGRVTARIAPAVDVPRPMGRETEVALRPRPSH